MIEILPDLQVHYEGEFIGFYLHYTDDNIVYGARLQDSTDEELPRSIIIRDQMYIPKIERDMQGATVRPVNSKLNSKDTPQKHDLTDDLLPVVC